MKNIFLLLFIAISYLGVAQDYQFTISGSIFEARNKTASLSFWDVDHRKTILIDTFLIDDRGNFEIKVKKEPNLFVFKIKSIGAINLAINTNQKIIIRKEVDGLKATGSWDTDLLVRYEVFRKQSLAKWMNDVRASLRAAQQAGNDEKVKALSLQENKRYLQHRAELSEWVFSTMSTSVAVYATSGRWTVDDMPKLEILLPKFEIAHPNQKITHLFQKKVYRFAQIAKGALATDIISQDTAGNTISLRGFMGKYVLIDFWASWCGPCRRENPTLVKVYDLYKDKGFEIFGVTLDKRKDRWITAIANDSITWTQVSDLKGYTGKAPFDYNITAIPSNILISPTGRIITHNLFGPDLEEMLRDIFEK